MEEKNLENVNKGNNTEPNNKKDRRNFSIAGFCLGIISIVICCTINISMIIGILAIIFGALGIKSSKKKMSITAIVTGGIGIILSIIMIFVMVFGLLNIFFGKMFPEGLDSLKDYPDSNFSYHYYYKKSY